MQYVQHRGRECECAALYSLWLIGGGRGKGGWGYSHICHNNSHRYQFLFVFTLELFFVGGEKEEEEEETHFGHMAPFSPHLLPHRYKYTNRLTQTHTHTPAPALLFCAVQWRHCRIAPKQKRYLPRDELKHQSGGQ